MNTNHKSKGLEMPQETAKKLFDHGGVLIVLDLPVGSVFGIDMKVYQVGEQFRGLKMIPPGLHYIYYSAVSKEGSTAPRTGFFHYFSTKEILIKKWNPENEDLNSVEPTGEERCSIRENLQSLDRNLGPYPYDDLKQWHQLTCNISESLVSRFQPLSGVVNSVTQLIPLSYPPKQASEPEQLTSKRSFQGMEEKYLPDMKTVPGTELRFTEIPKSKYPEGSSSAEITMHNMDTTYTLEQLLLLYEKEDDLLGELQMAHICFLIAHVYDAFEHWKKLVELLCGVDSGLPKYSELFSTFLTMLHYQIKEIPLDFFVDITGNTNFILNALKTLFENLNSSNVNAKLKRFAEHLKNDLTRKYKWDFDDINEEDLPVIVEL